MAAWHYAQADLTLSHYDARARLVVARRVADSLTPGWRQFGAVWLPLPHLLNAIPAQWDWAFRTGAAAVAISIAALSWGLASLARYLHRSTGSTAAALAAPAVILLNPNVLYLQSTPMSEPLLFGLALVALEAVDRHVQTSAHAAAASWALTALVMTRYEGWLICAALLFGALVATARYRTRLAPELWQRPAAAILLFVVFSRVSTGAWFVSSGFFVPEPELRHQIGNILHHIREGIGDLMPWVLAWTGAAGAMIAIVTTRKLPNRLLPLATAAAILLPFVAFYQGHPYRVRYLIPVVLAAGTLAGIAIGSLPRRWQLLAAAAIVAAVVWMQPPLNGTAPMIVEAQWESPFRIKREAVTESLRRTHDGTPILASMGSLGHYMQEASSAGFRLGDFLHEGNGDLWIEALKDPSRSVRWILIEEQAEGGDMLARRAREDHAFLSSFERVSASGGLALYARRSTR